MHLDNTVRATGRAATGASVVYTQGSDRVQHCRLLLYSCHMTTLFVMMCLLPSHGKPCVQYMISSNEG